MSKNALKVLTGIFAVIVLSLLLITFSVDRVVKSGIEENGSELLQTAVTVDKVSISLFNGSGTLEGFKVHNPEGFSDASALYIEEASVKLDLGSLLSDQVVVNEVIINSPDIFFEQEGVGVNLRELSNNMNSAQEGSQENSETKLVVERLVVTDGKITVSSSLNRNGSTEVSLSEITINDIGGDGNNTVRQTIEEILKPIFQKATEDALKDGVTEQIKDKVMDLFDN